MNWPMPEKDKPTAFVDVDHTLLLWSGGVGDPPMPLVNSALIEKLATMKGDGYRICIWSYGGELHARQAADYCKITHLVDWYCGKPTLIIDDAPERIWQRAVKQLP